MKQLFPSKLCKLLVLIVCVALIAGLAGCFGGSKTAEEKDLYTVAVDNLEVHKKAKAGSRVLGQLPLGLEIEILEEKTVKETLWGRIDTLRLPDGTKVKGGWIELQYVRLPGETEPEETEPVIEVEVPKTVPATMGTVIAGELNIRKGPDSNYETDGAYYYGDRIEILETQTNEDTLWGRTNLGWVGMGYVRMDGTPVEADENAPKIMSDGNTGVLGYGVVNLGELNVRLGPGPNYSKTDTVTASNRYAYYQLDNGWARIEDGWVLLEYFYLEGTIGEGAMTGSVTEDNLNIRTGPSTDFQSIGTYGKGDVIEILAQVDAWGYTEKGWVFINYVEEVQPTYSTGAGTVTIGLNIRTEPNAESEIAGSYSEGDIITILEVDGSWGKTDKGWINLKYVNFS